MVTPVVSTDPEIGRKFVADTLAPTVPLTTGASGAEGGGALIQALKDNIDDAKANRANVLRFGLVGDRVTANDTAFADLMVYLKTLTIRPAIYFPGGFYLFNSQPVFDLPGIKIIGDGMDASFIVSDAGVLCNYPIPTIRDISVSTETASSSATGWELRNCWHANAINVGAHNFAIGIRVTLTDEGEGLIPGNTSGGPYPVSQFTRHSTWPNLDEFVRDSLTTTEHWGSRVTIVNIKNPHVVGRNATDIGIQLDNPLADPANDYDDFSDLSGASGQGMFYTAIKISGGHIIADGTSVYIGGGVHGVKITDPWWDIGREGLRLDYGAQKVHLSNVTFDFGGDYAVNWLPGFAYSIGDKIRRNYNEYTCATAGTSAANINHNGVPNSEFVGYPHLLEKQPVAGGDNPNDQLTQSQTYGMKITSDDVQVFIEGITLLDGVRWLDMATYLPSPTGSSEAVNIFFGNHGRLNLYLDCANGDQLQSAFMIQHRDPKLTQQPAVLARIRASTSGGSFTEQSTGVDVLGVSGFVDGLPVTLTDNYTLSNASSARVSPFLLITYSATQSGWFPFRVAHPQINKGASLGSYVRTYGRPRSRWQDGPQGTGTGIADGTVVWDYSGNPISAINAPRVCWEVPPNDTNPELRVDGRFSTDQPSEMLNPPPHYFVVRPNPTNMNGHPTTVED